jgi:hypothetical protein
MENQNPPTGKGDVVADPNESNEEDVRLIAEVLKLLMKWDLELAAQGKSPLQHYHDEYARELVEKEAAESKAKSKRRRRRKHYPAE